MTEKRWRVLSADKEKTKLLQSTLGINPVLCQILVQRGIDDYDKAFQYFRPSLSQLHDPWLMKDMAKAVERIAAAIESGEKILVYGDYDVDGTTAVASFYSFLRNIYSSVDFYIPHRYREGYGVSKAGIDFAKAEGFHLIVSLDCGIKSFDLISYAAELGIDFVVCDHHLPDEQLPPAVAILNPKQPDCAYPYKELCGCGVGLKLMMALAKQFSLPDDSWHQYLDLVATAIAADIVPITGENRTLAYLGLQKANKQPNHGIHALGQLSGIKPPYHIHNLVFMIAPRVNAAGRMDDASKAVRLFIAESAEEAMSYAEQLNQDNSDRKEADATITREALEMIRDREDWLNNKSTVLFQPHWHKGVVGIVASRVIEQFYRPTIVLTQSGEYAAGSARSVPGFNLYEAIHACREHLLGYGGHFAAAGMTLELNQVDAFREKFESVVAASIDPELLIPEVVIDAEVRFTDLTWKFYDILNQMEPFGPENDRPTLLVRGVRDTGYSRILKEQHLKVSFRQDQLVFSGIGFGMGEYLTLLQGQEPVDVAFKLEINEWNGQKSLQLRLVDIKPAQSAKAQ
jgi:single-stranded-DNA-specific exonuclease